MQLLSKTEFIDDQTAFAAAFVSVLRPVLQGFAYLSMFVCAFVIFNTFSVVVTQRFRELALIRAVGGTPAQVRRSLMVEGLVIGLVSSVLGILGGVLLTLGVQAVLDRFDLGLPTGSLSVTGGTVLLCMLVGTIVTVLSVIVPAFRAGRTKPVEAMQADRGGPLGNLGGTRRDRRRGARPRVGAVDGSTSSSEPSGSTWRPGACCCSSACSWPVPCWPAASPSSSRPCSVRSA